MKTRFRMTRRALIGLLLLPIPSRAFGGDYGTVRSKFTAIIRRKRDGPLISEWRNSDYRDFTIIGMNPNGGSDDFRVSFSLVHTRKTMCELVIKKNSLDAQEFGLWLGTDASQFEAKDVIVGTQDDGVGHVTVERVLAPGSYRVEGVWRGRRYAEILGLGDSVELNITIHGIP